MSPAPILQPQHLQIVFDSSLCTLIWLVQLIIYPAFLVIRPEIFPRWHRRYIITISCLIVPLISGQAILELYRFSRGCPDLLRLFLIATTWTVTAIISVPCHRRLKKRGMAASAIHHLIRTNWLRTLCWTALFAQTIVNPLTCP